MAKSASAEVPPFWLWLIRAASWIVPRRTRLAWRQQQETEIRGWLALLLSRGETAAAVRSKVRAFCFRAVVSASHERFSPDGARMWSRRFAHAPSFFLLAYALVLAALALLTNFFLGIRTLYAASPYADADRLVTCYQVHFLSVSLGVQARYIQPWRGQAKTLAALAACQARSFSLALAGRRDEPVLGARVTPDFFAVLGVQASQGRTFMPADAPDQALAIVSHSFWQNRMNSDPHALSREIKLDGRGYRVIGILPPGFWYKSRALLVWSLLPDLGRSTQAPRLVDAVGRLRPGARPDEARAELEDIAARTGRFQEGSLRVVPLAQSLRPVVQFGFSVFAAGTALALGFSLIQLARSWKKEWGSRGGMVRYWTLFFAKTAILLAGSAVLCAEVAARNTLAPHPFKFFVSLLCDWAAILLTLLVFRWSVLDQARRCPVCLRRLSMPVTFGSWSSPLLEPPATELLCDEGHGSLLVSEAHSSLGQIRHWVALDESWRELFHPKQ